MVDVGSSVNVLYHNICLKMNLDDEQLEPCHEAHLYGFDNQLVSIEDTITLSLLLGESPYTVEKQVKLYVIWVDSPYNTILGRQVLVAF